MGTHCGWPQWACRPPRCRVLSTIRPHCMAASSPAHTAACSGEPPLRARAGRGQSEGPEALSSCTQGLHRPRLPDAPPRGHCPGHGGHFASPWPPPHHLFLISLSSPAACLPSPTQHQAQHNPQPQLVLIRAGGVGEGGGSHCYPSRPPSLLKGSHQLGYQEVPTKCVGPLLTPERLPLPLWRGMRLTEAPSRCVALPCVPPKDEKSPPWPPPFLTE